MINGIKLPVEHSECDLINAIIKKSGKRDFDYRIMKKSVDARFGKVQFVYNVDIAPRGAEFEIDKPLFIGKKTFEKRPIVVGGGPCGLFAAYVLAISGAAPILIERGRDIDRRKQDVEKFQTLGILDAESNVQFGEGGAGTFSDGKLTTRINDPLCREVLRIFCECGADKEIMYLAKPHLGTDNLLKIIKNLREKIINCGGEVHFGEKLTGIAVEGGTVVRAVTDVREYDTDRIILALGHSARDTFEMVRNIGADMEPKAFSVGVRIEHLQSEVDKCQYGDFAGNPHLGAADYRLAYHNDKGRGVYTFCMCPGGYVMASSSEPETVVTNGMSYSTRNGKNANSAFLVGVSPDDFGKDPFDGIRLQRKIESLAYKAGGGSFVAPCQRLGDFMRAVPSVDIGSVEPTYKPGVKMTDISICLPDYTVGAMRDAAEYFAHKMKFFGAEDALLTGVESRSSSPVRLIRGADFQSNIKGLYPSGEGAGYAGGIMSAAADGMRVALAIIGE